MVHGTIPQSGPKQESADHVLLLPLLPRFAVDSLYQSLGQHFNVMLVAGPVDEVGSPNVTRFAHALFTKGRAWFELHGLSYPS